MSHTFNGKTITIHYNSDLSGEATLVTNHVRDEIDPKDLLDFVAHYIRTERISELEQADTLKILGLKKST